MASSDQGQVCWSEVKGGQMLQFAIPPCLFWRIFNVENKYLKTEFLIFQ